MGLAASQARLLTITARKADCEFQSMSLSHQKIALSRDMERISDEYHDAMNKTKLVYDYYGTGTSQMNLNYALLMTPSVYNDYFPKFLTDRQNRVVLSPEYAAAAKAAGIPHEGYNGVPSSEIRNAFVEALRDNGIITSATAVNIESIPYNNEIGLGSLYSAQQATMDITYDDLLNLIKANCPDTMDYGLSFHVNYADREPRAQDGDPRWLLSRAADTPGQEENFELCVNEDSNRATVVSLYDLLTSNNEYLIYAETGKGANLPIGEAAFMQKFIIGESEYEPSVLNWLVDSFSQILGGVQENDLALQYAYNQIYDLFVPSATMENVANRLIADHYGTMDEDDIEDYTADNFDSFSDALDELGTKVGDSHRAKTWQVIEGAKELIGVVYNGNNRAHSTNAGNRKDIAVDLNTIVDVFFTAYKEYLEGIENSNYSYEEGQKLSEASLYKPKGSDVFKILAPTNVNSGEEDLVASFYDSMFNIICTNGWTENENIGNAEYMQELLKSGSVFISSIDNDAYYYQSSYSTDTYISEIADTEAIAQAEAKYNAQKARIESKENTIDMKMKNLDTEISSLTTEYDTMKNVINKSIEKSFKRYDA